MFVSTYTSPGEVPSKEWDGLSEGATIYSTSGWLGVRDEELPEGAEARYLLARDTGNAGEPGGPALAGMETYAFARPPHPLYAPGPLLAGLLDTGQQTSVEERPFVLGSGWSEFRGQVPGLPDLSGARRSAAVDALARETFSFAESRGSGVLAYFYLPREDALEVARAHDGQGAVLLFHDVETSVPTGQWRDFDDYLAWLPSGRRPRARRELRRFQQSERRIREVPLAGAVPAIAPLNSALMRKHGHAFDEARATAVYSRQARHLSDLSSVLLVEENDRAVGFALRYRLGNMLYARVAGFDYGVPNLADYFNLVFYRPILSGFEQPTQEIHLGLGTFQAKLARGALPKPLYSVFVGVDQPLAMAPKAVRRHNERRIADFSEEFGRLVVGGLDTTDWLL